MSQDHAPTPVKAGLTVGHYAILRSLGKGGMGEVFAAHDTRLDRKVAIKFLPEEFAADSKRLQRFEVEAKALAALNHPNIVSVFSIEENAGRHFLVMELVEGRTLRELIPPAGLPLPQFLDIAVSLADAMGAAHARGVMHRDLKPENIMVTPSGWVKILDFGLAKFRTEDVQPANADTRLAGEITSYGLAMGTAPYMSPEQAEGDPIDVRSDIFSLGVVFHEMLTGSLPFQGRTVAQLITSILRDDPPRIAAARADVPPALDGVVTRCLNKRPDGRYSSGIELYQTLKQLSRETRAGAPDAASAASLESRPASDARWVLDSSPAPAIDVAKWLDSRLGITALIAGLFAVNWIETNLEELWTVRTGSWVGYSFAQAFGWVERGLSFERHDLAGATAVYGGAIAYFFLPLLMLALTLAALVPRSTREAYRLFALAIAVSYALSLPFYLFLPVPERWAYPESQAILLSDLWTTRLIETIRPISGVDNCFPSFHVSGTFDAVFVWYLLRLRYRHTMAFLGGAVAISTVLLGIHWLADVVAGLALAIISVRVALWLNMRWRT